MKSTGGGGAGRSGSYQGRGGSSGSTSLIPGPQGDDALTGALSRASLQHLLPAALERAEKETASISLVMLDLDYFKSINDAFGHARGDAVLYEFVARLKGQVRAIDSIFRYGGDEFVVLLPGLSSVDAASLAERLLHAVTAQEFGGTPPLALSMSVGVAAYPAEAADADALLELADRRVYQAKRGGRGFVCSGLVPATPNARSVESLARQLQQPSRLIERDAAQQALRCFVEQLAEERTGVFTIVGQPGSGASAFLQEAATLAKLRGYRTLFLQGKAARAAVPFAALQASRDWLPGTGMLEDANAACEAIARTLREVAGRGMLIILDDADAIDRQSLDVVRRLVEREGEERTDNPIGLVCAGEQHSLPNFRGVPGQSTYLEPLSVQGLGVWLRSLLQVEMPRAFVEWLRTETGGLPAAVQWALLLLAERNLLVVDSAGSWTLTEREGESYRSLHIEAPAERSAPASAAQVRSLPVLPALPSLPYGSIGRGRETSKLKELLDTRRVVTITGPGGVGKTHLALHVASQVESNFEHGALFVPLAVVCDPDFVVPTIAQALKLDVNGASSVQEALTSYLAEKNMLLILDNFEQVVAAGPVVADLLQNCPRLRFLVTSREALHIRGEYAFRLSPLAVPSGTGVTAEHVGSYPAVELFVERASAANPAFELTPGNAGTVAAICAQLDGLPLAIELVAARAATMPLKTVLARLGGSAAPKALQLLKGGPRDLPQRHQSLRSTVAWSYDLLQPEEQRLFQYLGAFQGGVTLVALEAIFGPDTEESTKQSAKAAYDALPPFETPIHDLLSSLLSKSLVQLTNAALLAVLPAVGGTHTGDDGEGELRYSMLETIREHAGEHLAAGGAMPGVKKLHASYFTELAEASEAKLLGSDQKATLATLAQEYANLRAALAWSIKAGYTDFAVRIAGGLWRFWWLQGLSAEGRGWLDKVLALLPGDMDEVAPDLLRPAALALQGAGVLARSQCDYGAAQQFLDRGLLLSQRSGDAARSATLLNSLGLVALDMGRYAEAQPYFLHSMELEREMGDKQRMAVSLNNLGGVAHYRGDYEEAVAYYRQSLALRQELGDNLGIANSLHNLGEAAYFLGNYSEAADLHVRSLQLRRELGDVRGTAPCFEGLAGALAALDREGEAATLFGAVEALREQHTIPLSHADRAEYEKMVQHARASLPPLAFDEAWERGRSLSLDEATRLAISACAQL